MTRRLLTLIFTALTLVLCPAAAQNLKFDIVKFELNQLDGTASNKNYEKIDGSGNKYAIIKVRSTDGDEGLSEFMFNFNSLKSIVVDKGDELWVYVQKNAKIVTISREGYTPLRNFDLKMTLQAGKTYNMEITYDRVEKIVKKELRMQMVSFELIPAVEGAIVMYKKEGEDAYEEFGKTDKFGNVAKNLKFGTYEYQVIRSQYYTTQGIIKLSSTEVHTEKITLKPKFSTITLSTNEGADIYVNNELKGRGSWTGPLDAGDYVVECKQQNHRSTSQSITVEANADKTIELQKPTPITGFVSVISSPSGATVLIDGKERGKTPCNISDVLVGNRKVTLSLAGYATASTSIEVKEGEVADVNLTLNSATSTSNTISQVLPNAELEGMYNKGKEAYDNKNYSEAVKYFRKAAEQGYAKAQYNLGICYYNGEGVTKDGTEAVKWYRKAAEQGNAGAQFNLGNSYYNGEGVEKNFAEAVKWYKKAAEQGNAEAQYYLGNCYGFGVEVTQDCAEAVKWYRKAAEQGYAEAQYNLGNFYYWGNGVEKNYAEAIKWYKKAAEQGYSQAQCELGYCYSNGKGVEKNLTEAAKWYKKAAEQGHKYAQYDLGNSYKNGQGVEKNLAEAAKWYKKAAEQGYGLAQLRLAEMYEKGEGVDRDIAEAVKWYNEAGKNNAFAKDVKEALKRLRKQKLIDKNGVPIK